MSRPFWPVLAFGLGLLVISAIGYARGPSVIDGICVIVGAIGIGLYVDRALRWLKERP